LAVSLACATSSPIGETSANSPRFRPGPARCLCQKLRPPWPSRSPVDREGTLHNIPLTVFRVALPIIPSALSRKELHHVRCAGPANLSRGCRQSKHVGVIDVIVMLSTSTGETRRGVMVHRGYMPHCGRPIGRSHHPVRLWRLGGLRRRTWRPTIVAGDERPWPGTPDGIRTH
jgi:hypothetical protein